MGRASPQSVLRIAQDEVDAGYHEQGVNLTKFGRWYGAEGGQWCAMFVSWCLGRGGFSPDGGETVNVPGLSQTTRRGWAFVPYMTENFAAVGRKFSTPEVGDIFCVNSQGHTGLVAAVNGDGTFTSAEGNYNDHAANVRRSIDSCYYLRPPYAMVDDDPLGALTDEQLSELYQLAQTTNDAVGRLEVALRDQTGGLGASLAALGARLGR